MWYAVVLVIAIAIAYATMPKPQSAPIPAVGEVKAPTAEEGRSIPVLFGTREVEGPNVTWYGDVKTTAIKK